MSVLQLNGMRGLGGNARARGFALHEEAMRKIPGARANARGALSEIEGALSAVDQAERDAQDLASAGSRAARAASSVSAAADAVRQVVETARTAFADASGNADKAIAATDGQTAWQALETARAALQQHKGTVQSALGRLQSAFGSVQSAARADVNEQQVAERNVQAQAAAQQQEQARQAAQAVADQGRLDAQITAQNQAQLDREERERARQDAADARATRMEELRLEAEERDREFARKMQESQFQAQEAERQRQADLTAQAEQMRASQAYVNMSPQAAYGGAYGNPNVNVFAYSPTGQPINEGGQPIYQDQGSYRNPYQAVPQYSQQQYDYQQEAQALPMFDAGGEMFGLRGLGGPYDAAQDVKLALASAKYDVRDYGMTREQALAASRAARAGTPLENSDRALALAYGQPVSESYSYSQPQAEEGKGWLDQIAGFVGALAPVGFNAYNAYTGQGVNAPREPEAKVPGWAYAVGLGVLGLVAVSLLAKKGN